MSEETQPEEVESSLLLAEEDLESAERNLWLKAMTATEQGNYDYAIVLLQRVLLDAPGFLDGRRMLRRCAIENQKGKKNLFGSLKLGKGLSFKGSGSSKKDPQTLMAEIEEQLVKDPYDEGANEALYEAAMRAGLPEVGSFALETIRDGAPDNTRNLHRLAEHYIHLGEPDFAQKTYEQIIRLDSTDMDAVKGSKDASAQASMKKQKWSEKSDFRDLLKNEEQSSELEAGSRSAMTREQIEERISILSEQYEEKQSDLSYAKKMGSLHEKIEKWSDAIQWYEWAYSLSDQDSALKRRIELLKDRASEDELLKLEEEIAAAPDSSEKQEKQEALNRKRAERSQVMIEEARERVRKNPTDRKLRFELGEHLYHVEDYSEAIPELQQAKSNPHLRIRAMLLLGRCFSQKSMYDMAAGQLAEAAEELSSMDHTKKDLLYELGLVYEKMGETAKSLECMKQIYEVEYGYRDVAQRVESSYTS